MQTVDMKFRLRSRRRQSLVFAGLCLVAFLYVRGRYHYYVQPPIQTSFAFPDSSSHSETTSPTTLNDTSSSSYSKNARYNPCDVYPKDSDIVIVVKTGATEASRKIPTQLLSFLSCAKDDLLIFSDLEEDLNDFHIYDTLDSVVNEAKLNNTDFSLYNTQKQYVMEGGDIGSLTDRAQESWAIDKYKNIHTAQKAWELRPNKSWYFFIDADTYIVWSSFFAWLRRFDPTKKLYLGAQVPSETVPFAHGGSGYALSRASVAELVGVDAEDLARRFDIAAKTACCGDIELAKILDTKGITVTDAHPMINGEKPRRYKFGPRLWCQPLITMHHIYAEEMRDLWQFQQRRHNPKEPLLFEELFSDYLMPVFPTAREDWSTIPKDKNPINFLAEREDWDNLSEDIKYQRPTDSDVKDSESFFGWKSPSDPHLGAYKSLEDCKRACMKKPECFQFVYSYQKCYLSKSFKLGGRRKPEENVTWSSGWELDRIEKFRRSHSPCKAPDYTAYYQIES